MFTSLGSFKEYPHNDRKPCEQTIMDYYGIKINSVDKSNVCLPMALQLVLSGTRADSCQVRRQREQVAPPCKGLHPWTRQKSLVPGLRTVKYKDASILLAVISFTAQLAQRLKINTCMNKP